MNKTTSPLTDAVLRDSAAVDAVLGSFDFGAATLFDDVFGFSGESPATRTVSTSRKMKPDRENQKRRIPWLGL